MAASLQRYSVFMDQIPVLYSHFPRFHSGEKICTMAECRVDTSTRLFRTFTYTAIRVADWPIVLRSGKEKSIRLNLIDGKSMSYE